MREGTLSRELRRTDIWLVVSALALLVVGLATLYSVSLARDELATFKSQLARVAIGVVPVAILLWAKPATLRRLATPLYLLNLALLAAVIAVGSTGGGAKRWVQVGFLEFQPSELTKLLLAITLAAFFAARRASLRKFSTFALSFLHAAVPAALVFWQPHLGAALVLIVIWLSIAIVAGVPARFIATPIVGVAVLLAAGFFIPGILKPYQKERLTSLFGGNEQRESYQATMARIAFGSGGVTGAGYLKGAQKKGGHIPDQHTDFIFSVVGEEGGFVGATLVVLGFSFFFYRGWLVMVHCQDLFARLVAAGILGALAFHTVVNLYMNVQMLPVVGLWLPFFSYGGTAMWLCMASVAVLVNLRRHERGLLF